MNSSPFQLAVALAASILLTGATACAQTPEAGSDPVAEAPAGSFRGVSENELEVYRGIPFAEPPVGDLRWRAPQPLDPIEGEFDATGFGPACMQPTRMGASIYADTLPAGISEDCLNLNVWAPEDAENAPVFVWIHGGSLMRGANSQIMYDGSQYAERGIVYVSINYRLGVLGYMAHPQLSHESPDGVSGNYGLLDQIAALEWVRDNIAAFGGNPDNVTIAGESAGALSVTYLMVSPRAEGLFHRAIAQSAYTLSTPRLREPAFGLPPAEGVGLYIANQLGISRFANLRAMDATELVEAVAQTGYIPWGTVDGVVIPDQPVNIFDRGEQAAVPLIAGFNEGEIRSLRILLAPIPDDADTYEAAIRTGYGDLAEETLARYPSGDIEESMLATTRDAMYGWTAERLVRQQAATGQPGYLYYFNHSYPAADALGLHAFHASELPFMFGNIGRLSEYWPAPPDTPSEHALADTMIGYWSSFARDGVPSAESAPEWEAYGEDQHFMEFDGEAVAGTDLMPGMFELHETVMCRRRAANVGWHWNVGIASPPMPRDVEACR